MEWNTETNRTWLLRIAAFLFALADLADQAAWRSRFVRRRVLAILSPAEETAYRCVADAAREFGVPVPASAIVAAGEWMAGAAEGDSPDDAMRLALRLRVLAAALVYLLSARLSALPDNPQAERYEPAMRMGRPAAVASAHDTS